MRREFTIDGEYHYDRSSTFRWILAHTLRYKAYFATFILGSVLLSIVMSLVPQLTGRAINEVLQPQPDPRSLLWTSLAMLGAIILRLALELGKSMAAEILGKRMERNTREELYLSLLSKSQAFHDRQRVGDLMARTANDVSLFSGMTNPGIDLIFNGVVRTLIPMIFIGFINPMLLIAPVLFVLSFVIALYFYVQKLGPAATRMREQFGHMNAELAEVIDGIEVVKSSAQEERESHRFSDQATHYRNLFVAHERIQAGYIPPLLLSLTLAGGFLHGLLLLSQGQLTIGDLIAYLGLIDLLSFPTRISVFAFAVVRLGVVGAARIIDVMEEETALDENEHGYSGTVQGEIVFDHVSFGHDAECVLEDISFHARPGEIIAIVGQTGSGKSTLTQLVNRIYDVDAGRVLIDGVDVRDWNLDVLRSQIGIIEQDISLFSRSIADNIAFGLSDTADQAAIEQAARDAQAHEFITSFPDGYDTLIGERGVTLSGGQKQRLAIARALLSKPHILILDDSTSAIDSATEDEIQKAFRRLLQGRTTLLISHRLSQIRWADKIVVLKQGRLVDQGSHSELLERCESYRRIFVHTESVAGAEPDHSAPRA